MKMKQFRLQVFSRGVSRISLDEIGERLRLRYELRGLSRTLWLNDFSLLRRVGVHPADVTTADLERVVAAVPALTTKTTYIARFRSIFRTLRELDICDNDAAEHLPEVRKPRGLPRPLTDDEAARLMLEAGEPFRDWFLLGCLSGFRAMEVSGLRGSDLELGPSGWTLRVRGKGGTDLVVPAHDRVVEMIQAHNTSGRLWNLNPNKVSHRACREMARLGVDKKFHACRHWYATALLAATGGDVVAVQELMRHQSVNTTLVYAKLQQDRPRLAINALTVPAA